MLKKGQMITITGDGSKTRYHHGWADAMNEMLGKSFPIENSEHDGSVIIHYSRYDSMYRWHSTDITPHDCMKKSIKVVSNIEPSQFDSNLLDI